jgi:DNA-binding CsgD family transcriptional regulator
MTNVLSARQRQVLRLTAAGCTSTQIAHQLNVKRTTVTNHLSNIYRTLGAKDRAHAVALAIHWGHITLAELATIASQEQPA